MKVLRTPDEQFENLPDYPFVPHYLVVEDLRIHYVDEGPREAEIVLMMHGEPSWSFLYRHMIPLFVEAGYRAIAPDLVGFGRSDKPADRQDYTYQRHVDWMAAWMKALDLHGMTLIGQDWGALIGLRLVAEHPQRFSRVVVANGALPTGERLLTAGFESWLRFSQGVPSLPIGRILNMGTQTELSPEVRAAYEAPFPDESYKEGARIFPALVPISPDDPAAGPNRRAWEGLMQFEKPFLTAFSDGDPVTRGGDQYFRKLVPGAVGQPHTIIAGAGHFLQEDKGPELARVVLDFMAQTPMGG